MRSIYLVPGFFGFANIGELKYFAHVRDFFESYWDSETHVHYVHTRPTASLRRRAERLLEVISHTAGGGGHVHVIGHSTGGLDGRMLVSPGFLSDTPDAERWLERVRSVVAVSSPHHGAPIARAFTSVFGQRLLKALSLATIHTVRLKALPLGAIGKLAGLMTVRADAEPGGLLEQVVRDVLADFDGPRRQALQEFFEDVGSDTKLLTQLTPEAMEIFNSRIAGRDAVRYGSVVSRSRAPVPGPNGGYLLYTTLHRLARLVDTDELPELKPEQREALAAGYGEVPPRTANDAIVPTWSQVHGEVVDVVWADHLDVIGHFHDPGHLPPHVDWLPSHTGFRRLRFEETWEAVGRFMAEAES